MIQAILMMLVLGALLGAGLGFAAKVFHVEPDERVDYVAKHLPNYNCGACGYPGCSGFADAIVSGDEKSWKCKPCKADAKADIIEYLKTTPGPDGKTVTVKG
jgi:electron transport complex protein RnfB